MKVASSDIRITKSESTAEEARLKSDHRPEKRNRLW